MNKSYLSYTDFDTDFFVLIVGVLVHEYWHIVTKGLGSIESELSSYNTNYEKGMRVK
jgi:hypothetical protein